MDKLIHIWENHHTVFIDLKNKADTYPISKYLKSWYADISETALENNVSYHARRLQDITGYPIKNETTLKL